MNSDPSRVLLVLKSLLSQQFLTYLCSHVCPVNSRRLPAFLAAPHLTSTLYVSRFEYVTAWVDKQVGIVPNSVTKDGSCRFSPLTLPVHFHNNVPSTFTSPHSPHSGSVELARELANLSQLREAKLSRIHDLASGSTETSTFIAWLLASVLEPCPTAPPHFGSTSFHSTQLYKQSPVQTAAPST